MGLDQQLNHAIIFVLMRYKYTLEIKQMDELSVFKETEIQNKDELLITLKNLQTQYKEDDSVSPAKEKLLACFIEHIESRKFPICDDWWFYQYDFTRFGMTLEMCHCQNIVYDSEDDFTMTVDESLVIVEVQCEMLSVSDFAQLHGVKPVAVRQWIRRGKLRAIQKQGRDWLIASIAEKPARNYKPVLYEWARIDRELYKSFPFLKGVNSIQIKQNSDDKSYFDISLGRRIQMKITSAECERLELALLAINDIEVDESDIY